MHGSSGPFFGRGVGGEAAGVFFWLVETGKHERRGGKGRVFFLISTRCIIFMIVHA